MNNRNYNPTPFQDNVSALNQDQDFQEEFNNALIEAMQKINTNYYGGYGIQYYNANLGQEYQNGFANNEYWDVIGSYTFQIKPGKKPSEALMAFFQGPTVADCGNAITVCQLAALLKVFGEEKFDAIFSDPNRPLLITEGINGDFNGRENIAKYFFKSENVNPGSVGQIGNRPINKGDMCQIWGIPYYGIKHPGGFSRLYNSLCVGKNAEGKDLFIGFAGLFKDKALTEEEFMRMLINEYNLDRDVLDMNIIQSSGTPWAYDMNMNNVKEKLSLEEGFKDVIGFMPNIKVTPAYDEIKKYKNMQIGPVADQDVTRVNRRAPYRNDEYEETITRKPERVSPTLSSNHSSSPEPEPTSNYAESHSPARRHLCRFFFPHHYKKKHLAEEVMHVARRLTR